VVRRWSEKERRMNRTKAERIPCLPTYLPTYQVRGILVIVIMGLFAGSPTYAQEPTGDPAARTQYLLNVYIQGFLGLNWEKFPSPFGAPAPPKVESITAPSKPLRKEPWYTPWQVKDLVIRKK